MSEHTAENDAGCICDYPYLGAQLAGTPIRCERCRRLVLEDGQERIRLAHEKALAELDEWAKANPITRPIPPAKPVTTEESA